MSSISGSIVNLAIFSPLVFAALVALLPSSEKGQIRVWTFIGMVVNFALCLGLYLMFDPHGHEFQMESRVRWVSEFGTSYHVGVDGLAASLILLTGFLGPLVVWSSWTSVQTRVKEFHIALLVIQTAMLGALGALDLVVFYMFFELMLIPMYLLVGVWGSEDRLMAAMKFFLYTLAGSLLMLAAILAVYFLAQPAGARSFDYATVYNALLSANHKTVECATGAAGCVLPPLAEAMKTYGPFLFLAFALAFAIKVPMFPVHTWLPDAHVQAPVAGSIILAGVMLKMGTFGFWRYAVPLFPVQALQYRGLFLLLSVIGIVYGALMCLAQKDIKKLIAYSSVSHLGFCMLGIFAMTPEGAMGSAYQMLNHGVSTGALFLLFGFLYERRHSRLISDYGGIAKVMPLFAVGFLLVTFTSIAVPGTNGFVGEFLVLLGSFGAPGLGMGHGGVPSSVWLGGFAALAIILGAAYMLWMVQRVFFGPVTQQENLHLTDMGWRETAATACFAAAAMFMGLAPQELLNRLQPSAQHYVERARLALPGYAISEDQARINVMPLPPLDPKDKAAAPPAVAAE